MDPIPSRHGSDLDLQHLKILQVLLAERSLTKTALSLDLTQPAISKSLARLRTWFGDPLFVRVGMKMEPTPRAIALAEPVKAILDRLRDLKGAQEAFDPLQCQRMFSLAMVDAAVVQLLPALLNHLRDHAPGVNVQAVRCEMHNLETWLETGLVDLAIGDFPSLEQGIHRHPLWREGFVSVLRGDHPRQVQAASAEGFAREKHALVSSAGTGHGYQSAEKMLEKSLPAHNIVCRVPTFAAAALVARHSDCVATLPRTVGLTMASDLSLHVFDCPVALPAMELAQSWHDRYHRDPGNRWLREVIRLLFVQMGAAQPAA